jgi:hypothetical protein
MALCLLLPAGRAACAARDEARSWVYSFEHAARSAAQPASARKTATRWVTSARREETRARRLAALIADSAAGRRLEHLTKWSGR